MRQLGKIITFGRSFDLPDGRTATEIYESADRATPIKFFLESDDEFEILSPDELDDELEND